jgi:hypothetical protein
MQDITTQRCHNHMLREAVARCPECSRFFCRECITEHDDKVLCAACLGKRLEPAGQKPERYQWVLRLGQFSMGILLLYVLFYYLGQILMAFPASFHEGTLWQSAWWKGP